MSAISRGAKNAFRNSIRTVSITLILALSIGLALVMLLSMKAADAQIASVKHSVGNTVTITPAGSRGFEGGGNPLVTADVAKVRKTGHITNVTASLSDRLSTTGSSSFGRSGSTTTATTNLTNPITPGDLAQRFGGGDAGPAFTPPSNFSLPIMVTGTDQPGNLQVLGVSHAKLTAGSAFDGKSTAYVALVGKDLASKNSLSVGSTFTAYSQTITVSGIYDAGNTFADAGIMMPLATAQTLSSRPDQVTNVVATVDSIGDVAPTTARLQKALGTKADVVSDQSTAADTLSSLDNIKTIATYSFVGALVAGAVIVFLSMLMIVRERRREIGVLKAIGSSNTKISLQFVAEALTFTGLGAAVGVVVGWFLSNPVLDVLASSTSGSTTAGPAAFFSRGGGLRAASAGAARINFGSGFGRFTNVLSDLHTTVGFDVLVYGLLAAAVIAIVGAAVPAWLTAKVRPAEVMRTE